jgi:putative selenate reductase molybdopterin-binding subunit
MICSLINNVINEIEVQPSDSLLTVLRALGYYGVKHGCESGEWGACTILLDGTPINACVILAAQADGHRIQTIESVGQRVHQGWQETAGLNTIQSAFVQVGAVHVIAPAQNSARHY